MIGELRSRKRREEKVERRWRVERRLESIEQQALRA
jgi:hypothetical protein